MGKDIEMGQVYADVELFNAGDQFNVKSGKRPKQKVRSVRIKMLVDTGSTMMTLPPETIKTLGLQLTRVGSSRVADGRLVERRIFGPVTVKVFKRTMQTEAVEGSPGVPPLLGQIPLEGLELLVDAK